MKAVVPAAGEGTRLRPLTEDRPKGMVEVDGRPILADCFEQLAALGAEELIVVVGYEKEAIVDHFGHDFEGVPVTYAYQSERLGLAHALSCAEEHVEDDFVVMLGDNVFRANLEDVVCRHRDDAVAATLLVEEVPPERASRYGVCELANGGELDGIVEKPDDPPSNVVATGFYAFSPDIFTCCRRVRSSERGEYELTDAINLLVDSGRSVGVVPLEGWRVDVAYPEDRREAELRLRGKADARDRNG